MSEDSPATPNWTDAPLTVLIGASAMGTYLLLAVGGVTSLLDGSTACSAWPTCGLATFAALGDPAVLVAVGHRLVAVAVGVLLVATLVLAWRHGTDRVRASVLLAVGLYPFQAGLGALTAIRGPAIYSTLHLILGVGIFALIVLALLWHLEHTTASDIAERETPNIPVGTDPRPTAVSDTTDPGSAMVASRGDSTTRDRLTAYLALTKPRLQWLLCLVAVAAMALAAGPGLSMETALVTVIGGMLAVGSSGTFNNVLERDVDRRMDRTADRPLVQGRIPVARAVGFGVLLALLSVGLFVHFVNVLAAVLALLAILFYSIVYTLLLKPNTSQNTVLGGAVGAFPALIGWAAVENSIGLPALVLGGVIFLWTPAHFYNLALAYRDDYARAGFPMLPVVRGTATTRRHILLYLGATLVGSVVLGLTTRLEWLYAIAIVLVGAVFLWAVLRLFEERSEQAAFRSFHASNAYLGVLLVAILLDTLVV